MDTTGSAARRPANALLVAVAIASALVLYGAVRFPASVAGGGATAFLMSGAGLLAYALTAAWARRPSAASIQTPIRFGSVVGFCIAGVAVINHTVEISISLPAWAGAVFGGGMWGLMFLGFGIACSATFMRERSIALGILSSVWSAMVYAAVMVAFGLTIGFAFMPHMQRILSTPYTASGMTDPSSFVARQLVSSASEHLFIAPVIALLVGCVSAVACSLLLSVRRRTGIVLGIGACLLCSAGIASIRIATYLPRAQRPPFIDFGLAALAVTLASAYPVVAAIRRSRLSNDT